MDRSNQSKIATHTSPPARLGAPMAVSEHDPSSLVLARTSYVDSIEIQQNRFFRTDFLKYAKAECGSTFGPEMFFTYGGRTRQRLWLHQPTRHALDNLRDKDCSIFQVQVALDLLCASESNARTLQKHIEAGLIQSVHPYEPMTHVETTTYLAFSRPRGTGTRIALYSDRTSKVHAEFFCCHIEFRIQGAAALRDAGLSSADEIIRLNHREFWAQNIRLVHLPDADELGERYVRAYMKNIKRRSAKFPYGGRTAAVPRYGHLLMRTARSQSGDTTANDLLHFLRERRPLGLGSVSNLFRPAPADWLLPAPHSGLWRRMVIGKIG